MSDTPRTDAKKRESDGVMSDFYCETSDSGEPPCAGVVRLRKELSAVTAERDALRGALYDGFRVYSTMTDIAKGRTSLENVADVLAAFAKVVSMDWKGE
jgi:hypothetical protein